MTDHAFLTMLLLSVLRTCHARLRRRSRMIYSNFYFVDTVVFSTLPGSFLSIATGDAASSFFASPIGLFVPVHDQIHSQTKQAVREAATICPRPCDLNLLTLKVLSESRVMWATSVPILVFVGLSVIRSGPMYATDRQTSGRLLICPRLGGGA